MLILGSKETSLLSSNIFWIFFNSELSLFRLIMSLFFSLSSFIKLFFLNNCIVECTFAGEISSLLAISLMCRLSFDNKFRISMFFLVNILVISILQYKTFIIYKLFCNMPTILFISFKHQYHNNKIFKLVSISAVYDNYLSSGPNFW